MNCDKLPGDDTFGLHDRTDVHNSCAPSATLREGTPRHAVNPPALIDRSPNLFKSYVSPGSEPSKPSRYSVGSAVR